MGLTTPAREERIVVQTLSQVARRKHRLSTRNNAHNLYRNARKCKRVENQSMAVDGFGEYSFENVDEEG